MSGSTAVLHSILSRQLNRFELGEAKMPDDQVTWRLFLGAIQEYYESLETSRNELEERHRADGHHIKLLQESIADLQATSSDQSQEHYQALFERTPVPTWEEDFRAVAVWADDLRTAGVKDLEKYLTENPDELREAVQLIEVTNVNQAAARMVGATEEATLIGPIDKDLVDEKSGPSFVAQLTAVWDGEDSVRIPLIGSTLAGEGFDAILEWQAPRVFGTLDYSRVLVTIVDITEQKEAERDAHQRLKSKEEFIASVTHELRTPLASVLGFAEVLRTMDDADLVEERDDLLGVISDQATDLSDLVEDLLVAARSELGQLHVVDVPVNIHAQIAQVIEGRGHEEEDIRVPPRPEEPVMAQGDPQRVRQILRNLLTNAGRYGGPQVAIVVDSGNEEVSVRVLDNGKGLDPGDEERVFQRYMRNSSTKLNPNSVGIGLTIASDLARRMGGELAYSRVGGWTCFALTLPALVDSDEDDDEPTQEDSAA
ncbi:MAG: ATP-binding protein [Acidimicrobiia bacterium]